MRKDNGMTYDPVTKPLCRYIFILHSPRFWEVIPPTKRGMKLLLDYIRMVRRLS